MGQACPQLHNLIYSSHLFAGLGSEIQAEESQNNLINDLALTPTQEGSNLVTRTCEKKASSQAAFPKDRPAIMAIVG